VEALTSAVRKLPIAGLMEPDARFGPLSRVRSRARCTVLLPRGDAKRVQACRGAQRVVVSLARGDDLGLRGAETTAAGFADAGRADGRGLDQHARPDRSGGGRVTVTSELGRGTFVAGSVPL